MAISAAYEDSASISTTEYSLPNDSTSLTPITVSGVYQIFLNLSNMVAGDEYQFKIYEKVTVAGSQIVIYTTNFVGVQTPFVTPSLILMHGWDVTLKRISGSDRTLYWSIRTVA